MHKTFITKDLKCQRVHFSWKLSNETDNCSCVWKNSKKQKLIGIQIWVCLYSQIP